MDARSRSAIMSPTARSASGGTCRYACWSLSAVIVQPSGSGRGRASRPGPERMRANGRCRSCETSRLPIVRIASPRSGTRLHVAPIPRARRASPAPSAASAGIRSRIRARGLRIRIRIVRQVAAAADDDLRGAPCEARAAVAVTMSKYAEPPAESMIGSASIRSCLAHSRATSPMNPTKRAMFRSFSARSHPDRTFVALDAGEPQVRARIGDPPRDGECFLDAAAAGATAHRAAFEQQVSGRPAFARARRARQQCRRPPPNRRGSRTRMPDRARARRARSAMAWRPTSWFAISTRAMPCSRQTRSCCTVATVIPQAPSASWRPNSSGLIDVLPCGAIATPVSLRNALIHAALCASDGFLQHRERQRQVFAQHVPAGARRSPRSVTRSRRPAGQCPWSGRRASGDAHRAMRRVSHDRGDHRDLDAIVGIRDPRLDRRARRRRARARSMPPMSRSSRRTSRCRRARCWR